MMLLLLQRCQQAAPAALSSEDTQQQEITQRMPNFCQQTQNSDVVGVVSNPKALQAWSQIEQGLQLLVVEASVNAMVDAL